MGIDFSGEMGESRFRSGLRHAFTRQRSQGYEIQEQAKEGVGKGSLLATQAESVLFPICSHFWGLMGSKRD